MARVHIRYLRVFGVCAILVAIVISAAATASRASAALPSRITVRQGHFVDTATGEPFVPLGMNYYRMGTVEGGRTEHVEFLPGFYNEAFIETMMADAQRYDFNVVRVFLSYDVGPDGILTSTHAQSFNPAYISNVVDFLRRAKAHGQRVIFTSYWTPHSDWLASLKLPTEDQYRLSARPGMLSAANDRHLYTRAVRTRANLIVEMIEAIRRVDPSLLDVIMSWELENESAFFADGAPFDEAKGTFQFAGKIYDLSADAQKQALMDAISLQWANVCADAVHAADSGALVSDSVFSFAAVRREGPGTMSLDETKDRRLPVRPLALVQSHLDYLDFHTYASTRNGLTVAANTEADLSSDEWNVLITALKRAGKPIIAGENGLHRSDLLGHGNSHSDVDRGLQILEEHTRLMKAAGIAGTLYWSYGSVDSTPEDPFPPLRFYPAFAKALTDVYRTR